MIEKKKKIPIVNKSPWVISIASLIVDCAFFRTFAVSAMKMYEQNVTRIRGRG